MKYWYLFFSTGTVISLTLLSLNAGAIQANTNVSQQLQKQQLITLELIPSPSLDHLDNTNEINTFSAQSVPAVKDLQVQHQPLMSEIETVPETATISNSLNESNLENITSETSSLLQLINQYSFDGEAMVQVNSVSQFRDVSPQDWAYEALQNLVERYGCIAGYPNGTYRGNRAMTRYEFAAGLFSCLQQIERLIAVNSAEAIRQDDLAVLERLLMEFETELETLETQVDNLEASMGFLEANQFSTTTKLNGFTWFNLTGAFGDDTVLAEGRRALGFDQMGPTAFRIADGNPVTPDPTFIRSVTEDPNVTLSMLTWLSLNSSFQGRDTLIMTLAAGNGNSPINSFGSSGSFNNFPVPFTDQTPTFVTGSTDLILLDLYYRFPVTESFELAVGPAVNYYNFFDFNRFTLFFTGTSSFQSIEHSLVANVKRGAGAIAGWQINDQLRLNAGYLAQNTEFLPPFLRTATDPSEGLFGGTNFAVAELTYSPIPDASIRFLYAHSNIIPNPVGQVQPLSSLHGIADDGPFGFDQGGLDDAVVDTFAINFDWLVTPKLGLFGRYNYAINKIFPISNVPDDEIVAQAFQIGVAFPDLGKEGAMATLSFAMPFDLLSGEEFLVSGAGDGGTQYNIEATYFYPINRNIAIVPAFYAILNPNNFSDNPTVYVANIRTQFRF